MKLNKGELEHIKNRVENIVKCTNGEIATKLNRLQKGTGLTNTKKYNLICEGKATILSEHELLGISKYAYNNCFEALLMCFKYPKTTTQVEKITYNDRIKNKTEELMQEVTLEGKRLIDKIVLGLVELESVPEELHKLGSMTSLARVFTTNDFIKKEI